MQFGKEGTVQFYDLSADRIALIYKLGYFCFERLQNMWKHSKVTKKGDWNGVCHTVQYSIKIETNALRWNPLLDEMKGLEIMSGISMIKQLPWNCLELNTTTGLFPCL